MVTLTKESSNFKYKHYGKTVEKLIETAIQEENPERKAAMVQNIANFMKMAYVQWNKDNVADEVILKNLAELSNGQLTLEENVNLNKVEFRPQNNRNNNNNNNRNRNKGRNNNNNNNNNNGRQRNNNNKQRH